MHKYNIATLKGGWVSILNQFDPIKWNLVVSVLRKVTGRTVSVSKRNWHFWKELAVLVYISFWNTARQKHAPMHGSPRTYCAARNRSTVLIELETRMDLFLGSCHSSEQKEENTRSFNINDHPDGAPGNRGDEQHIHMEYMKRGVHL